MVRFRTLHNALFRLRNSRHSASAEQTWRAACEKAERDKKPGWRDCKTLNAEHFEDTIEAREECETNIVTLIQSGADPSIAADVHAGHSEHEGLEALDMARKHELGDFVVGVMVDAMVLLSARC